LSSIFSLPPQTLHIFHDPTSATIAFNSSGALFCNFHYFHELHLQGWAEGDAEKKVEAVSYWWVVLCHELAHNLIREHGAQHSFYAESFAQQYFG
ncbi:hypothetical protein LTS18_001388, partial [Coniosporium uncinatum]